MALGAVKQIGNRHGGGGGGGGSDVLVLKGRFQGTAMRTTIDKEMPDISEVMKSTTKPYEQESLDVCFVMVNIKLDDNRNLKSENHQPENRGTVRPMRSTRIRSPWAEHFRLANLSHLTSNSRVYSVSKQSIRYLEHSRIPQQIICTWDLSQASLVLSSSTSTQPLYRSPYTGTERLTRNLPSRPSGLTNHLEKTPNQCGKARTSSLSRSSGYSTPDLTRTSPILSQHQATGLVHRSLFRIPI